MMAKEFGPLLSVQKTIIQRTLTFTELKHRFSTCKGSQDVSKVISKYPQRTDFNAELASNSSY